MSKRTVFFAPEGEAIVAMCMVKDEIYVATTKQVYLIISDDDENPERLSISEGSVHHKDYKG